jgi:hypothetical protein
MKSSSSCSADHFKPTKNWKICFDWSTNWIKYTHWIGTIYAELFNTSYIIIYLSTDSKHLEQWEKFKKIDEKSITPTILEMRIFGSAHNRFRIVTQSKQRMRNLVEWIASSIWWYVYAFWTIYNTQCNSSWSTQIWCWGTWLVAHRSHNIYIFHASFYSCLGKNGNFILKKINLNRFVCIIFTFSDTFFFYYEMTWSIDDVMWTGKKKFIILPIREQPMIDGVHVVMCGYMFAQHKFW